ncbi:MAG: VTT domain-containing protein [Candidatus Moranbacteria bacterium]|nr:VTT domain-containing protein [Candidatus Moranbacteria bacterium]
MSFFGVDLITLIQAVGYTGLFAIVFAETGLFLGFFLPGDSLLFVAGFLAGQNLFSLPVLIGGLCVSAILGNVLGYEFGRRIGPKLFNREDSFIFKKAHALRAQNFYEKHGPKTIVLARFMPIVRTFAPIVAGVANMHYPAFLLYNIIGAILWTVGLVLLGYFLGSVIDVDRYLLPIILLIVFLSFLPGIIGYIKEKRSR